MGEDVFKSSGFMNVRLAKIALENAFDRWGLDPKYEFDDYFNVDCDIHTDAYKDSFNLSLSIYPSGLVTYYFYFDYLKKTPEALNLINEFNDCVVGLKASISDIGCLIVCHEAEILTEKLIVSYTESVLDNLTTATTVQYLQPLIKLTHK